MATPTGALADIARTLAPTLAARGDAAVALRRLPDAQWRDLVDSGLMSALAPRWAGGGEVCAVDFVDAVYEVARAEANTGWVYGVCGVHPYQIACFDPKAQDELWGGTAPANNSSSFNPTGRAEAVEGGYRVSGRWSFSTGCDHCEWVVLGGLVGTVEVAGRPARDLRSLLLPREDYRIDPVWHTAGMAGTGSHDIVVDDVFVPEYRSQSHWAYRIGEPLPGWTRNHAAIYRIPFSLMFGGAVVAATLGAVAGFLDGWTDIARERIGVGTGPDADNPFQRRRLAEARYDVDSAFSRLKRNLTELEDWAEARPQEPPPDDLRARTRFEGCLGVQRAVRATDELYGAASGRIVFLDHPLHRRYQDIKAAVSHAYLSADAPSLAYGAALMGRPVLELGI